MGHHSRKYSDSDSRSRSRSRSRRHHHDSSRRHRHSRDRSESNHLRSRSNDRKEGRYSHRDSRQSSSRRRDYSRSRSRSSSEERKKGVSKPSLPSNGPSRAKELPTNSAQFIMDLKSTPSARKGYRFDEKGREVNEYGQAINTSIIRPLATLAINQKKQATSQINPYLSTFNPEKPTGSRPRINNKAILDSRIKVSNRDLRNKKALSFIKEGTFVKRAEEMRNKKNREIVSQVTLAGEADTPVEGAESEKSPIADPYSLPPPNHNPVPEMEWWDYELLPREISELIKEDRYDGDLEWEMLHLDNCITKEVIEHPAIVERNKLPPPKPLPLMLTKKERKKERKRRRKEEEEKKQLHIQAGLLPKPEQKLNYRNFKLLLGTEALTNPTWADNLVREQIEKRKLAHEQRNQERKLTPKEASEKKERKIVGDKNGELEGCLFRIGSLSDKKLRFKVNVNAKQYQLAGRCLIVPSCKCCMLYVEGTKKAMKGYRKLLLNRIKWNEIESSEDSNNDKEKNECVMLWQGIVRQFRFKEFIMTDCMNDGEARGIMEEKSLVQHWDAVIHYHPSDNMLK